MLQVFSGEVKGGVLHLRELHNQHLAPGVYYYRLKTGIVQAATCRLVKP